MEHGARLSTSRVMAIAFIFMSVLIVLSLSVNVIQGVNNYRLQNEQRTAVTPMAFNAPFAVSQNSADASYLQQMALSFIALRLNVSSETVDASHQALLQYIRPGAQAPKALHGIGIRIEDDVFVTEHGCDVYTTAPKTIAEIEEVMRHDG